jgi:hypothetical protein
VADIKRPTQEVRLSKRRERSCGVQKGGHAISEYQRAGDAARRKASLSAENLVAVSPKGSEDRVVSGHARRPAIRRSPNPKDDERRAHPFVAAADKGG